MAKVQPKHPGPRRHSRWLVVALAVVLALVLAGVLAGPRIWNQAKENGPPHLTVPDVPPTPATPTVIDYEKIKNQSDPALQEMIAQRKNKFNLEKSVDMVVSTDEAIRVGQKTVSFAEILAAIRAEPGADTGAGPAPPPATDPGAGPVAGAAPVQEFYGVHVVKPGDNLWKIHMAILVEYLRGRGVDVSQDADQKRLEHGWSPGVSRIVKWAETIVHIYNVKSGRIDHNLHQLAPEQKVVVVSLTRLDQALGGLKPENIDRVRFRGGKLTLE